MALTPSGSGTSQSPKESTGGKSAPRMTSDPRFQNFVQLRQNTGSSNIHYVRNANGSMSLISTLAPAKRYTEVRERVSPVAAAEAPTPFAGARAKARAVPLETPTEQGIWKQPSPANPFGEPEGKTDPRNDLPMPKVSPEIRAMAQPGAPFFDTDIVTPDYIKGIAQQDNDLAKRLAANYLDEYSKRMLEGYVSKPLDNQTVDDLTKLSQRSDVVQDIGKGIGEVVGGLFGAVNKVTRAPVEYGAMQTLATGFEQQPKTIDPKTLTPDTVNTVQIANVDTFKLPAYYRNQIEAQSAPIESLLYPGTPTSPDPDPARDKVYQSLVDQVLRQREDWQYYSEFATAADGVNTLFSTPQIRQAYMQGKPLTPGQEQNVLGTGNVAGLTSFERVVELVKSLKDAGVMIDPEDRATMRSGWPTQTVDKYAQRLAANGQNLNDIVLAQGMTWPELKRSLDLMNMPKQDQADLARSLGFSVSNEEDRPIFINNPMGMGGVPTQSGTEHVFTVDDPNKTVSLDDIRTKADINGVSGQQLAETLGKTYVYAYLADVKTVPFQDLAASIAFDPTNYGKLQLIWEPVGLLFKGVGKTAKVVGKGLVEGGAFVGDVGVGSAKTIGNLIGKLRGIESEVLKPSDWTAVRNTAHFLMSESSQSVANKTVNKLFFVTKSTMAPEYLKDGEGTLRWVDTVLPDLQKAARAGEWTPFIKEVPAGAGDYVASGLNSVGNDLQRIAADEDAFGRLADFIVRPFKEEIDKADIDQMRQLVQNGDYAGLTKWVADHDVSQRILDGMTPEEARKSLSASDLINHVTASYRAGVGTLIDKDMGVYGKQLVSPTAARINDMLSSVSRFWVNSVLTVRPGWNMINYLDNNARLLANGFNPSADVKDYERVLGDMGVTSTQLREIVYGGNFMDEAVRQSIPVTTEMTEATAFARKLTVNSEPKEIENLVTLAQRAVDSTLDLPAEVRRPMEDAVRGLRVEATKLAKDQSDIKAVRAAAARVDNLANQMFGQTAAIDTPLFRGKLASLKEYLNVLKSGEGKSIARIWNNFVELGHSVHRDFEASARMRVFAPTFIDKYHDALSKVARDLPQFPDEAALGERFAHIIDPQQKAEAVRDTLDTYRQINQRLNGFINEAALHPNKMPELQDYLRQMTHEPLSAARNFVYSTQPVVDGMTPAADVLMQKVGDWMTEPFDGMTHTDLGNPARMKATIDAGYQRAVSHLKVEGAEANMMARTNQIVQPTSRVPRSAANWLQDGQVTNPRDIALTVKRMEKMAQDVEDINQGFRDSFLELNHEPYLNTLDAAQQRLTNRAHRYDLMRDSFAERFAGEAKYGDETVQVVNGTLAKGQGAVAILEDGRTVPADAIQMTDPQRGWYWQQYTKWEKAKPAGNNVLTKAGIGTETATGAKMRRPVYLETGTPGMIPPDVARSYTRRMEDDIVAKGGTIPTEYVDADGVKHALAYETPEDFMERFAAGSGLGYYKPQAGGNVLEGLQRTADNWTHLAKLADATELDDLRDVYINGKKISELYKPDADLNAIKQRIFSEKSAKVNISYELNGTRYNLTNDPKRGETLTDVTRRLWGDKVEGIYIETRGQWVPVFDPNAAAGQRVTFKRLGADDPLSAVRVPVETGTAIPDELGDKLLEIQEVAEPVEQLGIQAEKAIYRLDNLLNSSPEIVEFKPDFTLGGADVMTTGKMHRLAEGGTGVEVRFADGRVDTVPVSQLASKPVEVTQAARTALPTVEEAVDPVTAFLNKYPVIQSRDDLLAQGALLRELGVPLTDDQLNGMADLYEAASRHLFKSEDPDFILKHMRLTSIAPTEGLYQRVNLDTPEFKKFFSDSDVTGDMAVSKLARGEAGEPLVMYHGTTSPGFEAFDLSKAKSEGLYGPGIYLTDDPKTASGVFDEQGHLQYKGYATSEERWTGITPENAAKARQKVLNSYTWPGDSDMVEYNKEVQKVADALSEGATPERVIDALNSADVGTTTRNSIAGTISPYFERGQVTGGAYPLYASIKNPLDIEREYSGKELETILENLTSADKDAGDVVRTLVDDELAHNGGRGIDGQRLYNDLVRGMGGDKAAANNALKGAGFDGITHVGGAITGNEPHRVFIAFEPTQVKSAIANRGTWDVTNPNMLFQRAEQKMTRQGWLTDEERKAVFDQAMAESKAPAEAMAKAAEGYPASQGLVGANGEPLFQAGPQGEVRGAYKYVMGLKPGQGIGTLFIKPGLTPEQTFNAAVEEFGHHMLSMGELVDDVLPGPELAPVRAEITKQMNTLAEAVGAPRLTYASERAINKSSRPVLYQQLYKVNWESTGYSAAERAAFEDAARAASERAVELWTNYVKTGAAPTKELKGVFQRFKEWLSGIFQVQWNRGERIPVEVKQIFDKWLTDNPAWDLQLTKKGKNFFGKNEPALRQAAEATKTVDQLDAAIDKLRVAYGDWNDSPAIQEFHETAKRVTRQLKEYSATGNPAAVSGALPFEETRAGVRLGEILDELDAKQELIDNITAGKWRPPSKVSMQQLTEDILAGRKTVQPKFTAAAREAKLAEEKTALSNLIDEARALGAPVPEDAGVKETQSAIDQLFKQMLGQENKASATGKSISDIMQPFWDKYAELLQDGKFYPKKLVDGKWVYPEGAAPLQVAGRLKGGRPTPPNAAEAGYLTQAGPKTVDEILSSERGTPMSLEELAALNAPNSTYVSPALVEIMKYHAGVKTYLDQWHDAMLKAVDGGFLPGSTVPGLTADDQLMAQKWLEDKYGQIARAATTAQNLAENKTRLVMMDFETTYNLDRLMQQGPALPQWTGKLAGLEPLRVGGVVPFFKFPRENIESWINTLGNHPALIHNVSRYQEQANIERKKFGLPEQFLPTWPVQVGDKVFSVSPFAFISLGQLIRPFSPYIDEDASGVDNAINVAGQMGFSLGPSLRLALNVLGLSQTSNAIVPQGQSLIPPQAYPYIADVLKGALGITSQRDEFYINRQIVYDALADLSNVSSESARKQILSDLTNAIQSPNSPRRLAAQDHYYSMQFQTANTGYWTGIYPREVTSGELSLRKYNTDLAQLRSAMVGAGLKPDQIDQIESYLQSDPRADAKRQLNALYAADPVTAVSHTLTEAWSNSVADNGKRSEYYTKRALIEGEYQQKYGFSGTVMTDADRQEYNRRIQSLNEQYADVLTPKNIARQSWQSEEDYQRNVSGAWLEYLYNTKPQYTTFKTYAEYQTAVDQWEKNLPQISRQAWQTLQGPFAGLTGQASPELPKYLDAVSNKDSMDRFQSQYDTVSEAIYSTLRDHYYSGYWDTVSNKVGAERLLAELEYKQQHPVPDNAAIQKWLNEGLYQGRFSQQAVSRELAAHPVADIENSILSGKTLPERQAFEISELLARVPPGNTYFDWVATLPKDVQKHLQTYQDSNYTANESPTKWALTYETLKKSLEDNFPQPTLNMVREWVNAVHENDAMTAQRDKRWPGLKTTLDTYNAIDRADAVARRQFRQQHPQIGEYYNWLYNEWQGGHPLWNEYYGNGETASSSSVGASTGTGYAKKPYTPYRRYSGGGGRRYSKPNYVNTYGAGTDVSQAVQNQWNSFRSLAGTTLYNALTNHWDAGTALTAEENGLLQSLYKQYTFGAKDFTDWLENVLPNLRSAMIPGTSIFAQKSYNQFPYQPQTSVGKSWFGKGKNAA